MTQTAIVIQLPDETEMLVLLHDVHVAQENIEVETRPQKASPEHDNVRVWDWYFDYEVRLE